MVMIALHRSSTRPCDFKAGAIKVSSSCHTSCSPGTTDVWEGGWRLLGIAGVLLTGGTSPDQGFPDAAVGHEGEPRYRVTPPVIHPALEGKLHPQGRPPRAAGERRARPSP